MRCRSIICIKEPTNSPIRSHEEVGVHLIRPYLWGCGCRKKDVTAFRRGPQAVLYACAVAELGMREAIFVLAEKREFCSNWRESRDVIPAHTQTHPTNAQDINPASVSPRAEVMAVTPYDGEVA